MNRHLHRRELLRALTTLCAAALVPRARACEFVTSTLRVTHPWTRATAPGADSAVVCMRFDDVSVSDRLVLVESPIAVGAQMGDGSAVDVVIPQGRDTNLDESGPQVHLVGLKFPLEVGRSYPLRLGFEKGGSFQAVLSVDYARFS